MLLACSTCRRAFPIGNLPVGTRVSCPCGAPNVVLAPPARQRRMANCGNCGGRLAEGATECAYCEARVTLAEEGFGDPCPFCFVPLVRGARFCNGCGEELRPLAVHLGPSEVPCARCRTPMERVRQEEEYLRCGACRSVWITRAALQRFLAAAEVRGSTPRERAERQRQVNTRTPRARPPRDGQGRMPKARAPVHCPECAQVLRELEFSGYSAVIVEECRAHGWWLDEAELEALADFVRTGGHEVAQKRHWARARMRRTRSRYRERLRAESGPFDLLRDLDVRFDGDD